MHDDTQVARVFEMKTALMSGQFPVRWVPDLGYGYGYPIFNFYGPLPYYIGSVFAIVGFDIVSATKIMMGIGMVLPVATFFLCTYGVFGMAAAFLGSLLYVYAPYHAVQLYVRGSVGELWTLTFFPLIVWGIIATSQKKSTSGVLVGSVGVAGVILSHTLTGFVAVLFLIAGFIFYWTVMAIKRLLKNQPSLRVQVSVAASHVVLLVLGLGISAFFWLPAFAEMKYTNVAGQISKTADFREHFVCIEQLWESLWGYAGSAPGCVDGMSFRLGKIQLIFAVLSILAVILYRRKSSASFRLFWIGCGITAVSLFFMTDASVQLWERIYGFNFLQYPWRFLALASFGLAIVGAYVLLFLRSNIYKIGICIVAFVLLWFYEAKLFRPQYVIQRLPLSYEAPDELRWASSKISDEYLPQDFVKPATPSELPTNIINQKEGVKLTYIEDHNTKIAIQVNMSKNDTITLNRAYFPGWHFRVNGSSVTPLVSAGLPSVSLTKGDNSVIMTFNDTPIRTFANTLSLLTVICMMFVLFRKKKLSV